VENNTIQCPFCLKESQRGVHVCTGCMATVLYGAYPGWYAAVVIFLTFGLSILIGMSTGMAGATISLPILRLLGLSQVRQFSLIMLFSGEGCKIKFKPCLFSKGMVLFSAFYLTLDFVLLINNKKERV
jgi:hypothetical protein